MAGPVAFVLLTLLAGLLYLVDLHWLSVAPAVGAVVVALWGVGTFGASDESRRGTVRNP